MEWKKYKGLQVSETGIVRNGSNVIKPTVNGYPLNDRTYIKPDDLQNLLFSEYIEKVITKAKRANSCLQFQFKKQTTKE